MRISFSPGRGGGGQIQPSDSRLFKIPDIVHGKDEPHRPRK
jgi:hypothetical protein